MTTADKLLSNFVLRLVKEIPQSRFLSYLLFVTDATDNVNEKNWARSMSPQILPKCSVDIGLEIIPLQKKLCRQYNTYDQLTNYLEKLGYFSNPPKKSCNNFFWVAQDLIMVQLILIMQKITKKSLFGHFLGYPPKMHYSALQCSAMY